MDFDKQLFDLWRVSGLGIDVLTLDGGRITGIWVLADELQRILQVRGPQVPAGQ